MSTSNSKKLKKLKPFKKYKLKNKKAAVNRVLITGPSWNRRFFIG